MLDYLNANTSPSGKNIERWFVFANTEFKESYGSLPSHIALMTTNDCSGVPTTFGTLYRTSAGTSGSNNCGPLTTPTPSPTPKSTPISGGGGGGGGGSSTPVPTS